MHNEDEGREGLSPRSSSAPHLSLLDWRAGRFFVERRGSSPPMSFGIRSGPRTTTR
jgi:hypothetical protein